MTALGPVLPESFRATKSLFKIRITTQTSEEQFVVGLGGVVFISADLDLIYPIVLCIPTHRICLTLVIIIIILVPRAC